MVIQFMKSNPSPGGIYFATYDSPCKPSIDDEVYIKFKECVKGRYYKVWKVCHYLEVGDFEISLKILNPEYRHVDLVVHVKDIP